MNALPYTVGIIGLGKIAEGYDSPEGEAIQTHVKACLNEPRCRIAALGDNDTERARAVQKRWNLNAPVFSSETFFDQKLDVICISTPDATHLGMLKRCVAAQPKLVLCEKPLARDPLIARDALADLPFALAVNHIRRWIPGVAEWIANARRGAWGRALSAVVNYNRGFWHNATHAFDLLAGFIGGEVQNAQMIGERIDDFHAADSTLSAFATLQTAAGKVPVWLCGVDGRIQSTFSVEILFEMARVRFFEENGTRVELALPASTLPPFAPELQTAAQYQDHPPRLMLQVWQNLIDHLEHKKPLACTGADALEALRLQSQFFHQLSAFGKMGSND